MVRRQSRCVSLEDRSRTGCRSPCRCLVPVRDSRALMRAAADVPPPAPAVESVAQWKKQLKTVPGLLEIIETSRHVMEVTTLREDDFERSGSGRGESQGQRRAGRSGRTLMLNVRGRKG
eukprot:749183-Hanusia_phi.AAC.10